MNVLMPRLEGLTHYSSKSLLDMCLSVPSHLVTFLLKSTSSTPELLSIALISFLMDGLCSLSYPLSRVVVMDPFKLALATGISPSMPVVADGCHCMHKHLHMIKVYRS